VTTNTTTSRFDRLELKRRLMAARRRGAAIRPSVDGSRRLLGSKASVSLNTQLRLHTPSMFRRDSYTEVELVYCTPPPPPTVRPSRLSDNVHQPSTECIPGAHHHRRSSSPSGTHPSSLVSGHFVHAFVLSAGLWHHSPTFVAASSISGGMWKSLGCHASSRTSVLCALSLIVSPVFRVGCVRQEFAARGEVEQPPARVALTIIDRPSRSYVAISSGDNLIVGHLACPSR
jgi:hypothetical protein